MVFNADHTCVLRDLDGVARDEDFDCDWEVARETQQLRLSLPAGTNYGCFTDPQNIGLTQTPLTVEDYEQMVQGSWAWSTDGVNHDYNMVFNADHTCELFDLLGATCGLALDCQWEIVMWTRQLKFSTAGESIGFFASYQGIKLDVYEGPSIEEYEEMIQGRWAWSTDGMTHDYNMVFNADHTCELFDLEGFTYVGDLDCDWEIMVWTQQLKLSILGDGSIGFFADPQNVLLYSGPTVEDFEHMIQGRWAWYTDGVTHDFNMLFNPDHTCELFDLYGRTYDEAFDCDWHIVMWT